MNARPWPQMQALPTVLAPIVSHSQGGSWPDPMRYLSTRGRRQAASLLRDPARRPGARWRALFARALSAHRRGPRWPAGVRPMPKKATPTLAFEVLSLYIDDIPADDLRALCQKVYTQAVFGTRRDHTAQADGRPGWYLVALSNGPTLAFKDMAMQLLGALFEYELARRGRGAQHPRAPHRATPAALPSTPCAASAACVSS
jgi:threonine synthase